MWSLSLLVLEVFYSCVGLRLFKKDPVEMLKESDDIITDEFGADDAASLDPNTHSVMKFLHVMFSARSSGSVFACEGDLLIVGDIILREIQDRAVTDLVCVKCVLCAYKYACMCVMVSFTSIVAS
eukprot:m.205992 g.205992  ORF g.205992 m.205992 type:complete len:125 (+) comp13754_c1_seq4:2-376(+)